MNESPVTVVASKTQWADVHVHLVSQTGHQQDYSGAARDALSVLKIGELSRLVVMPTPQGNLATAYDLPELMQALAGQKDKISFLGGGGLLNPLIHSTPENDVTVDLLKKFEAKANSLLKMGAVGFGEIAIHHLSHEAGHRYQFVEADHPLLLLLADIAAKNDVVIDIHMDPVAKDRELPDWFKSPPNPKVLKANIEAFERLLKHNENAKIVWAHAGSDAVGDWTPELTRDLLEKHPNLYMSLRMGPGKVPENNPLSGDGRIKPAWRSVFADFPDRFVIGNDQFFVGRSYRKSGHGANSSKRAPMTRERAALLLNALPDELAKKIGWENAAKLYKFN
jgi:predicted TIM-barrel fold metal-dependent hydrolase